MIYAIRTTSGREEMVIDMMSAKIKKDGLDIKSIFHPAEIKGYVFVEGSPGNIHKAMRGIMNVKGFIEKPVDFEQIRHLVDIKKEQININEGDTVEIVGGPFKGEKGKVTRVDQVKNEVTIELVDASIPIPVTIATEFVKLIKRAKEEEES